MSVGVHVFRSRGGHPYCLDVSTSAILRIDEDVVDLLARSGGALVRGQPELAEAQERGYLLPDACPARAVAVPDRGTMRLRAISLFVSGQCNFACDYCFNDGGQASGGELPAMPFATAARAIDLLLAHSDGPVSCNLFGGEPLLRFALIEEVVRYCESQGRPFSFGVVTNGSVLDDVILRFLEHHAFDVRVSYDGDRQDEQRRALGGGSRRDLVRRNIARLSSALPFGKVTIRTVLCRGVGRLRDLVDEARELGARLDLGLVTLPDEHPRSLAPDDLQNIKSQLEDLVFDDLSAGASPALFRTLNRSRVIERMREGHQQQYSCAVGKDILAVSTTGTIFPCHRFVGILPYAMGDVERGVAARAWRRYAERFVDNRAACARCWARYLCGGGCAHHSVVHAGDVDAVSEPMCDFARFEIELFLRTYATALEERPEYLAEFNACDAGEAAVSTSRPGSSN